MVKKIASIILYIANRVSLTLEIKLKHGFIKIKAITKHVVNPKMVWYVSVGVVFWKS